MKYILVSVLTLGIALTPFSTTQGSDVKNDKQSALDAINAMTAAFEKGDIAKVMNVYEDKATVLFEPGAPVSDMDQLQQMFTAMSAANPRFTYPNGHEIIVSGDLAMHIAPWEMVGQTPDGQAIQQSGLSVAILRRQTDGSFKILIDNPHGARLLQEQ